MSEFKSADTFSSEQVSYACVIERLRYARLTDGRTLSEALTLGDISFFDVFYAELTWRHMTTTKAASTLALKLKLHAKPFFLRFRQFLAYRRYKNHKNVEWPKAPLVICLAFTGRMYRDVLEPVVRKVIRDDVAKIVVLSQLKMVCDPTALGDKVSNISTDGLWNDDIACIYHNLKASLGDLPSRSQLLEAISNSENFDRLDRGHNCSASQILEAFWLLVNCYIPLMLREAAIAKYILTTKRPCMILSPDISDGRARLYSVLSRQYGIPSINIQFGLTGDEAVEWRSFPGDRVAVWGEGTRQVLLRHGVPAEKITVTGSPRFEYLKKTNSNFIGTYRHKLKIPSGRLVVLFASTYYDPSHSNYVDVDTLVAMKRSIVNSAKRYSNVMLVIKPHPVENMAETNSFIGAADNIVIVDKDSDVREVLLGCDAFISFGSTMTVDALLADKLCICPSFPGWPFSKTFEKTGALLTPQTAEEIDEIFSKISSSYKCLYNNSMRSARMNYLNLTVGTNDVEASEQILQMIREIKLRTS